MSIRARLKRDLTSNDDPASIDETDLASLEETVAQAAQTTRRIEQARVCVVTGVDADQTTGSRVDDGRPQVAQSGIPALG